jgi:hypothetical protein
VFWILGRGLRRALIRCTLGSGKSEKGLGFWKGGQKGAMGNKGEQFTDNLGPRWTIPVTTGGCQVSRRGGLARGNIARGTCICKYTDPCIAGMTEVMDDTSCVLEKQ